MRCRASSGAKILHGDPPPLAPKQALEFVARRPWIYRRVSGCGTARGRSGGIHRGADGRLWVVEMRDYPMGLDGQWKPARSGRASMTKTATARTDRATVFLDGLPFPTGVFAWRKGVRIRACTRHPLRRTKIPPVMGVPTSCGRYSRASRPTISRRESMGYRSVSTTGFTAPTDCWAERSGSRAERVSRQRRRPRR